MHHRGMPLAVKDERGNQDLIPVIESIERTGIVRNERSQLTIQDFAQPSDNRHRIAAVSSTRGLAFRDVIPVRLRLRKPPDPCRLFPFSIGASNRARRIDNRDFGEEVI